MLRDGDLLAVIALDRHFDAAAPAHGAAVAVEDRARDRATDSTEQASYQSAADRIAGRRAERRAACATEQAADQRAATGTAAAAAAQGNVIDGAAPPRAHRYRRRTGARGVHV